MKTEFFTLITGASTGFGKALALDFAAQQHNIIMVSLPCRELQLLGNFIEKNFGVKVYCFEKDLSSEQQCNELYDQVSLMGLQVNILVNNAGIGGTDYFENKAFSFYKKQLDINVMAPTCLSYLFLDDLKKNSPSHILNVSSLAGFCCVPQKQVYGGSKSYLQFFSRSLAYELKQYNIAVSVVCPGAMNTTALHTWKNKQGSWLMKNSVMKPEVVAKITIQKMFLKRAVIIPGFYNKMFRQLDKITPGSLKSFLLNNQFKKMESQLTKAFVPVKTLMKTA
ncbi:MAG: SDR family NAD(P)-dependent oxidoreductase [Ferruginibacter sp.]